MSFSDQMLIDLYTSFLKNKEAAPVLVLINMSDHYKKVFIENKFHKEFEEMCNFSSQAIIWSKIYSNYTDIDTVEEFYKSDNLIDARLLVKHYSCAKDIFSNLK